MGARHIFVDVRAPARSRRQHKFSVFDTIRIGQELRPPWHLVQARSIRSASRVPRRPTDTENMPLLSVFTRPPLTPNAVIRCLALVQSYSRFMRQCEVVQYGRWLEAAALGRPASTTTQQPVTEMMREWREAALLQRREQMQSSKRSFAPILRTPD